MIVSTAEVPTASASRYLQQLCKHFAHKIPAEATPTEGRITFPMGPVILAADATTLHLRLETADPAKAGELEDVVARHLVRFAFREELAISWVRRGIVGAEG